MFGFHLSLEVVDLLEFSDGLCLFGLVSGLGVSAVAILVSEVPDVQPALKKFFDNLCGPGLAIVFGLEGSQMSLLGGGP